MPLDPQAEELLKKLAEGRSELTAPRSKYGSLAD